MISANGGYYILGIHCAYYPIRIEKLNDDAMELRAKLILEGGYEKKAGTQGQ